MKDLSISKKMACLVSFFILVPVVIVFLSLHDLSDMNNRINRIVDASAEKPKPASRIQYDMVSVSRAEKNMILAQTHEGMEK